MMFARCAPVPRFPNLVAITTSFRLFPSAFPRYSWLGPYDSAVSNRVIPTSIALCTTTAVSDASNLIPKLLQPRPMVETGREPMERCFTRRLLSRESDPAARPLSPRPPPPVGGGGARDSGYSLSRDPHIVFE